MKTSTPTEAENQAIQISPSIDVLVNSSSTQPTTGDAGKEQATSIDDVLDDSSSTQPTTDDAGEEQATSIDDVLVDSSSTQPTTGDAAEDQAIPILSKHQRSVNVTVVSFDSTQINDINLVSAMLMSLEKFENMSEMDLEPLLLLDGEPLDSSISSRYSGQSFIVRDLLNNDDHIDDFIIAILWKISKSVLHIECLSFNQYSSLLDEKYVDIFTLTTTLLLDIHCCFSRQIWPHNCKGSCVKVEPQASGTKDFTSLTEENSSVKEAAKTPRVVEDGLCCCGCGVDASESHHYCSISYRRVIFDHYADPNHELGKAPCAGCGLQQPSNNKLESEVVMDVPQSGDKFESKVVDLQQAIDELNDKEVNDEVVHLQTPGVGEKNPTSNQEHRDLFLQENPLDFIVPRKPQDPSVYFLRGTGDNDCRPEAICQSEAALFGKLRRLLSLNSIPGTFKLKIAGEMRTIDAGHYVEDVTMEPWNNPRSSRNEFFDFAHIETRPLYYKWQRVDIITLVLANVQRVLVARCKWYVCEVNDHGRETIKSDFVLIAILRSRCSKGYIACVVGHISTGLVFVLVEEQVNTFFKYGWCALDDDDIDLNKWYFQEELKLSSIIYRQKFGLSIDITSTKGLQRQKKDWKNFERRYEEWKLAPGPIASSIEIAERDLKAVKLSQQRKEDQFTEQERLRKEQERTDREKTERKRQLALLRQQNAGNKTGDGCRRFCFLVIVLVMFLLLLNCYHLSKKKGTICRRSISYDWRIIRSGRKR